MPNEVSLEEVQAHDNKDLKQCLQLLYDANILTQENKELVVNCFKTTYAKNLYEVLQFMHLHDILNNMQETNFKLIIDNVYRIDQLLDYLIFIGAHKKVIKLGQYLNYAFDDYGLCMGFILRWLEACLLNEKDIFDKRVRQIILAAARPDELLAKINTIKEKNKNHTPLTDDDIDTIEILAFYESTLLYLSPEDHPELFEKPLSQEHVEDISQIAASIKILQQGGLKTYSEPNIYTRDEIITYLNDIRNIIKHNPPQKDVGLLLGSYDHAIGLIFQPEKDAWLFMDINQWPAKEYKADKLDLMVDKVIKGFNQDNDINPYIAFGARVITTHPGIIAKFELKENQEITEEVAKRKDKNGIALINIVAQTGHYQTIAQLAKHGADLNNPTSRGATPAYTAAYYGHFRVIEELGKQGADLNKPKSEGRTPAYIAAYHGHVEVIAKLAEYGADLNKPNDIGQTPTYAAAYHGHVEVIAELAQRNADLNIPSNDSSTPLFIASQKGQAEVVKLLLKKNVSMQPFFSTVESLSNFAKNQCSSSGIERMNTLIKNKIQQNYSEDHIPVLPSEIAHIMGHEEIVKIFAENKSPSHLTEQEATIISSRSTGKTARMETDESQSSSEDERKIKKIKR